MSLLEDVKINKDLNYIFCTSNSKDFKQEDCELEFSKFSKKEFKIVKDTNELLEYLDKKLELHLDIEARNKEIEEELKKKIGTITERTISYISSSRGVCLNNFSWPLVHLNNIDNKNEILEHYDFYDVAFSSIIDSDNNDYNVSLELSLVKVENVSNGIYAPIEFVDSYKFGFLNENDFKKFRVCLVYSRDSKKIKIVSVAEEIPRCSY